MMNITMKHISTAKYFGQPEISFFKFTKKILLDWIKNQDLRLRWFISTPLCLFFRGDSLSTSHFLTQSVTSVTLFTLISAQFQQHSTNPLLSNPILSNSIPSSPIQSNPPVESSPVLSIPFQSISIQSNTVQSSPIQLNLAQSSSIQPNPSQCNPI